MRFRAYRLEYRHKIYEFICNEYRFSDGEARLVIPYFLIPGRKYPIHVYLYAINLYSKNPDMGQRKAAELTREKYGLETFSHTTLGRVMKSLELSIVESDAGGHTVADIGANGKDAPKSANRFPSVSDTAHRRKLLAKFLHDFDGCADTAGIVNTSRAFVLKWFDKHRRLLI